MIFLPPPGGHLARRMAPPSLLTGYAKNGAAQ